MPRTPRPPRTYASPGRALATLGLATILGGALAGSHWGVDPSLVAAMAVPASLGVNPFEQVEVATTDAEVEAAAQRFPSVRLLALEPAAPGAISRWSGATLRRMRQLAYLEVRGCQDLGPDIPDLAYELSGHPSLRALDLAACQGLDDADLEAVARLRDLHVLRAGSLAGAPGIGDRAAAALADMVALVDLRLMGTAVTGAGLRDLGALPRLRRLDLDRSSRLGPRDLEELAYFETLEDLTLDGVPVDAGAAEVLAGLRQLRRLSLRGCQLDDATLEALAAAPHLERLDLTGTAVTDRGLQALAAARDLDDLVLEGCRSVTTEGVRRLRSARPRLEIQGL